MADIEVYANGVLRFNNKEYRCALGKAGVGIKRGEGDNTTPVGTYRLKQAFYRPDKLEKPTSGLNFVATKPTDGWCDDPADKEHYNQLVTLPHEGSFEKLWRDDDVYDIVIVMSYNTDPVVLGKGSAVFIHVVRDDYSPTQGCVALAKADLIEVLRGLSPKTKVAIHKDPSHKVGPK